MRISDFVVATVVRYDLHLGLTRTESNNYRNHEIRNPHSEIRNSYLRNLWIFFNHRTSRDDIFS